MHGIVPGFATVPTAQLAKELLNNVVGALRIDGNGACRGIDFEGIGEEFLAIFIDLFRHVATVWIGCEFAIFFEPAAEAHDTLTDGGHDLGCAIIIEPIDKPFSSTGKSEG